MSRCSLPRWPGADGTSWTAYHADEARQYDVCLRARLAIVALSYGQCSDFTDAWKSSDLCSGTPRPPGGDPVNRRVLAKIRRMTPDDVFALSVRVGVHNPDGTLTSEYGGEGES